MNVGEYWIFAQAESTRNWIWNAFLSCPHLTPNFQLCISWMIVWKIRLTGAEKLLCSSFLAFILSHYGRNEAEGISISRDMTITRSSFHFWYQMIKKWRCKWYSEVVGHAADFGVSWIPLMTACAWLGDWDVQFLSQCYSCSIVLFVCFVPFKPGCTQCL